MVRFLADAAGQIREFFARLELAGPGIADIASWRLAGQVAGDDLGATLFYGAASKPN